MRTSVEQPQAKYLRRREAAQYVGLSEHTLNNLAARGEGPRFLKAGKRICVYAIAELDSWLSTARATEGTAA